MTTTTAPTIADIADKAADVIETNGYHKRYLYDTNQAAGGTELQHCRVDVIGAINIALHRTPRYAGTGLGAVVEQALTARVDAPSLATWCDRPGTGKTDAIALLRDTAASLRTQVAA